MKHVLHFLLFFLSVSTLSAQDLLRGPYQQAATTNSIKILWRTSEATVGWVKVGDTPDNLDRTFTEDKANVDHIVQVTGLSPYTKYYYAVGYGDVTLASGIDHYILTNKAYGDTSGMSVWVIGDAGKANEPQRLARNAFIEHSKEKPVDFFIQLGDNAYSDGTDEEYQRKVFSRDYAYDSIMRYLHFYTTPGNHDYNSVRPDVLDYVNAAKTTGPFFDIHEFPINGEAGGVPSGTELYYSFDYGHVHFISLNSEIFPWTGQGESPMKIWLRQDLAQNKQPWTVVIFHQPPYSSGSHVSDDFWELMMFNMRTYFLPILEGAGVDLVLCGHSHVYERSYLINGHYKKSWEFSGSHLVQGGSGNPDLGETYVKQPGGKGTVYSVIGNSGSYTSEDDFPAKLHPVFYTRDAGRDVTGSIVLNVTGSLLQVEYINRFGEILDKYAIFKQIESQATPVKENYADKMGLSAYPNPSSDKLEINYKSVSASKANILVTDLSGKQVLSQQAGTTGGNAVVSINGWKQLPAGQYVVSVEIDGNIGSLSVVKAK